MEAQLSFGASLIAHKTPAGWSRIGEAVRVSEPAARAAAADVESPTVATHAIKGPAPLGDEGGLQTANLLVEKPRTLGEQWKAPTEVTDEDTDIDCLAEGDRGVLRVQITRAASSQTWQTLYRAGEARGTTSPDEPADALLEVARRKARVPAAQLADVVLAIDARETPEYAMAAVCDSFRQRHFTAAPEVGFASVWVVGPTIQFVGRLDLGTAGRDRPLAC